MAAIRWGRIWAVYGGVDDADTKNGASVNGVYVERYNDLNYATGKVGAEFATSQLNTLGVEYDYAHGHYPNPEPNAEIQRRAVQP